MCALFGAITDLLDRSAGIWPRRLQAAARPAVGPAEQAPRLGRLVTAALCCALAGLSGCAEGKDISNAVQRVELNRPAPDAGQDGDDAGTAPAEASESAGPDPGNPPRAPESSQDAAPPPEASSPDDATPGEPSDAGALDSGA